jgi:tetratricopeptide (TPR) repeat protein
MVNEAFTPEGIQIEEAEGRCEAAFSTGKFAELAQILAELPASLVAQSPQLRYYRGKCHLHADNWSEATADFQMVLEAASREAQWPLIIRTYLALARVYQRRELIDLAREYLQAAQNLARKHPPTTLAEEGQVALNIGRLLPDLGDNRQAAQWSTRALRCFEEIGAVHGQVEALWILAVASCYQARLRQARTYVGRALTLNRMHGLSDIQRLYLLNVRAQIHLHAGELEKGLATIDQAAALTREHPISKPTLYLHMTEAGLQRTLGKFEAAEVAYARAEEVLNSLGDEDFRPWLEMEWGWARVLSGTDPDEVRRRVIKIIDLQNQATRRTAQTLLGLLDTLEERYADGLARLTRALPGFQMAGEQLSLLAVRTYLAYIRLQMGELDGARKLLVDSLGLADRLAVDGFHMFWHPGIVADLYAQALRWDVHAPHVELAFVRRLRDAGIPALVGLLDDPRERVRLKAESILRTLGATEVLQVLDAERSAATRSALLDHLRAQRLPLTQLIRLEKRLRTAEYYNSYNWNRVAIFGYYVTGQFSREEIAQRVQLAESTVRNYITKIRQAFDATDTTELRRRAREEGFIQ